MTQARLYAADVLVLVATVVTTLSVLGVVRIRDTRVKIHAVSMAAVGVAVLAVVLASLGGPPQMVGRAALVAAFLLLTAPVSAQALARLSASRGPDDGDPG